MDTPDQTIPLWVQWTFNVGLLLVGALASWWAKSILEKVESLEEMDRKLAQDVTDLRVKLPTDFVSKTEHRESLDNIFNALRRIEDKIDQKVDKP